MRRLWIAACLPALVLLMAGGDENPCDMQQVEKAWFCDVCYEVLNKADLLSNHTYYVCPDCEEVHSAAGKCEYCEVEFEARKSGPNACPHCYAGALEVEVCVKTYHACPMCGARGESGKSCADCEEPFEEIISRAVIEYSCPDCGSISYKPGNCEEEDCTHKGKPLVRACSQSGDFPHGGTAGGE